MAKGALENLLDELASEITQKKDHVATGNCDPGEYKHMCGQIRGLLLAHDKLNSLLHKLREPDDD
jgi:hypothetical protein